MQTIIAFRNECPLRPACVENLLLIAGLRPDSLLLRDAGGDLDDGIAAGGAGALFYEFSLEDHVPKEHLIRAIDRFVDLDGVRQNLAPFYSNTGRPSVDPELMIRMLDLNTAVPDHSTFSKNRHGRFRDSDLLAKSSRPW